MKTPFLFSPENHQPEREYIFREAAKKCGFPAYIIEKDYMVCMVLTWIFEYLKPKCLENTPTPFLFKGGTTLSKIFKVINRMSEDIDLSLNMNYLAYPEPVKESKSALKRRVEALKKEGAKRIDEDFRPHLETWLRQFHTDFRVSIDASEPLNLIINYPQSLGETDYQVTYVQPKIMVETGGRAGFEPHSTHIIKPIAFEELSINEDECRVDALDVSRTFFEKLTLLHEMNHRGKDFIRDRQSRHLYDLVKIYNNYPNLIEDNESLALLETVRVHKEKYFYRKTSKWNLAEPGSLAILPNEEVSLVLKHDWLKMIQMFPNETLPMTFDELINKLNVINNKINH